MNNFSNLVLLSSIVGLVNFLAAIVPVKAQQFTIAPMLTITDTTGGQSKNSVNVTNNGREPLRVRMYAESFTYDPKKGFVSTPTNEYSAVPYLQFSPREMEIPPGVTRNVRVSVTVPSSLPNREYRAVVFVEDLKERAVSAGSGQALVIKARVASVFFFGKGQNSSSVKVNTATWDIVNKKLNILLENKGSKTAYPAISWRIEKDGKEIAKSIVGGVVVQSESSREVFLQTNDKALDLTRGEYRLFIELFMAGQKAMPFDIKLLVP
jgi:hypothetical protein